MLVVKDRTGVVVDHAVDARIIANGRRHYGYKNVDVDQTSAGWLVSWDAKRSEDK